MKIKDKGCVFLPEFICLIFEAGAINKCVALAILT